MREECASRRERGSSHHTGINAVGTQEKINVLGAESPSQLREGKAPPTQPPVGTKRKGHNYTASLPCRIFFCFPGIRQDRAFHGVEGAWSQKSALSTHLLDVVTTS